MDVLEKVAQQLGLTRGYVFKILSEILLIRSELELMDKLQYWQYKDLLYTMEKHIEFMKRISGSSLQKILILRAANYSKSRSKVYTPIWHVVGIRVFPTPKCPVCDNKEEELRLTEVFKINREYRIKGVYTCHRCGYEMLGIFQQVAVVEYRSVEVAKGVLQVKIAIKEPQGAWDPYTSHQTFCYHLVDLIPLRVPDQKFSDEINRISPNFSRLYNESFKVEKHGFEEVAGGGYRKALEFLIKDFCISLHPDQEEEIKSKPLAKCIEEYVQDINIREAAKRAAWLGNDQLHYLRRWTDKDIDDLKKFIAHTVKSIEHHLETLEIIQTMPEHKRS